MTAMMPRASATPTQPMMRTRPGGAAEAWRNASTGGMAAARRACPYPPSTATPTTPRLARTMPPMLYTGAGCSMLSPDSVPTVRKCRYGFSVATAMMSATTAQARATTTSCSMTVRVTWAGDAPARASRARLPRRESITMLALVAMTTSATNPEQHEAWATVGHRTRLHRHLPTLRHGLHAGGERAGPSWRTIGMATTNARALHPTTRGPGSPGGRRGTGAARLSPPVWSATPAARRPAGRLPPTSSSTRRPSRMKTTRSQAAATFGSCVTTSTQRPGLWAMWTSSASTSSPVRTSRAPVGSSAKITSRLLGQAWPGGVALPPACWGVADAATARALATGHQQPDGRPCVRSGRRRRGSAPRSRPAAWRGRGCRAA